MAPYDKFNEIYENECKDKLQNASNLLGNKIDIIEKQQLESKKQELIDFFEQYKVIDVYGNILFMFLIEKT